MVDSYTTSLFCLAEHCEYGAFHDEMTRNRIVVGIIDSSLSLKLQLDATLILKKAIECEMSRCIPEEACWCER